MPYLRKEQIDTLYNCGLEGGGNLGHQLKICDGSLNFWFCESIK